MLQGFGQSGISSFSSEFVCCRLPFADRLLLARWAERRVELRDGRFQTLYNGEERKGKLGRFTGLDPLVEHGQHQVRLPVVGWN